MNTLFFLHKYHDVISMYIKVGLQLSSQETQGQLARVLFRVILMQHGHYGSFFRFFHFLSNFLLPSSTLLLKVISLELRYWTRKKYLWCSHFISSKPEQTQNYWYLTKNSQTTTPMNIFQVSIFKEFDLYWPLLFCNYVH